MSFEGETERRARGLEDRVDELETIINDELGYRLGKFPMGEVQTVDCVCGETFDVNVHNGCICPQCGTNANERGESDA